MKITEEDKMFLEKFFAEELTEESMEELDRRMKEPSFEAYYTQKLNKKYDQPIAKTFIDYLPMILLIGLTIVGIYLFLK